MRGSCSDACISGSGVPLVGKNVVNRGRYSRHTKSRSFSPHMDRHACLWIYSTRRCDAFTVAAEGAATDTQNEDEANNLLQGGFSEMAEESRPGDLFLITLNDGSKWYVEAIRGKKKSLRFVCQGEQCRVASGALVSEGFYPKLSDPWVKRYPLLVSCLEEIRRLQRNGDIQLPSQSLADPELGNGQYTVELLTNLADFEQEVQRDPSPWCNGTGPDDAPLGPIDQSLLSAGELLSLMQGGRGVALLQLSLPAGMGGNRLPVLRPFIFDILKRMDEAKDIVIYPSKVPGGAASSLVIAAKRQPFTSWGVYLSGLGVQASIVAESEFYKMIIGRMMGYRIENIEHHIRSTGGSLHPSMHSLVDKELLALSKIEPVIPWK